MSAYYSLYSQVRKYHKPSYGLELLWAVAQWEHLPHKHEDTSSDLRTHIKMQVSQDNPLVIPNCRGGLRSPPNNLAR